MKLDKQGICQMTILPDLSIKSGVSGGQFPDAPILAPAEDERAQKFPRALVRAPRLL